MCSVAQLCLTLWDPKVCSPPGSSVHGIFQARILDWVAISYSRGSSLPGDRTRVSCICCIWQADPLLLQHLGRPVYVHAFACSVPSLVSSPLWSMDYSLPGSSVWDSLGKNTGVGCYALLQGIFLTQGQNPCLLHLLHCRWVLYHWATVEAQYICIYYTQKYE